MSSSARNLPRPKLGSRPAGKFGPKANNKPQEAKYIHGVTEIDRTKGTGVPWRRGEVQETVPSMLIGTPRCRACYTRTPPCDCGKPLYESEVDVYWTEASGYWDTDLLAVQKCEDIAISEAQRLGMKCIVLRSEHHNTATKFDGTGRKTGYMPADWHITLYMGDDIEHLLLQGHVYTFVGKDKAFPLSKLHQGNRRILETHEILEGLALEDAAPEAYWGLNASCGLINAKGQPVNADGTPIEKKVDEGKIVEQLDALSLQTVEEEASAVQ